MVPNLTQPAVRPSGAPDLARLRCGLAAGAALVLALTGCTGVSRGAGGSISEGALTRVAVEQRVAAPRITGTTLTGEPFDSAELAGQVIVYNVWGSWCAPCRKEAPALAEAARATDGHATFVGINTRDSGTAQAQALVREAGIDYESIYDPDGRLLLQFPSLPPSAIPSTIVVDADGRIAARILGETTKATLVGLVEETAAGR